MVAWRARWGMQGEHAWPWGLGGDWAPLSKLSALRAHRRMALKWKVACRGVALKS